MPRPASFRPTSRGAVSARTVFQLPNPLFHTLDPEAILFLHAFDGGGDHPVDLVLLGPESVRVELEEVPNRALEPDEQGCESSPSFADFKIADINNHRIGQAFEVVLQERAVLPARDEIQPLRARDRGVRVDAGLDVPIHLGLDLGDHL